VGGGPPRITPEAEIDRIRVQPNQRLTLACQHIRVCVRVRVEIGFVSLRVMGGADGHRQASTQRTQHLHPVEEYERREALR
jgi:hypothetical protein